MNMPCRIVRMSKRRQKIACVRWLKREMDQSIYRLLIDQPSFTAPYPTS